MAHRNLDEAEKRIATLESLLQRFRTSSRDADVVAETPAAAPSSGGAADPAPTLSPPVLPVMSNTSQAGRSPVFAHSSGPSSSSPVFAGAHGGIGPSLSHGLHLASVPTSFSTSAPTYFSTFPASLSHSSQPGSSLPNPPVDIETPAGGDGDGDGTGSLTVDEGAGGYLGSLSGAALLHFLQRAADVNLKPKGVPKSAASPASTTASHACVNCR